MLGNLGAEAADLRPTGESLPDHLPGTDSTILWTRRAIPHGLTARLQHFFSCVSFSSINGWLKNFGVARLRILAGKRTFQHFQLLHKHIHGSFWKQLRSATKDV
jgi:hypothetical protein